MAAGRRTPRIGPGPTKSTYHRWAVTDASAARRASRAAALQRVWARDGRELYFLAPITGDVHLQLSALPVRTDGAMFEFDTPVPRVKVSVTNPQVRTPGATTTSRRTGALVGMATPDLRTPPSTIILNWTQALKR